MVNIVRQNYRKNKQKYHQIEKELKHTLGEKFPIDHVGSTAIPKISGKNIIDILVGVPDVKSMDEVSKIITSLGFYQSTKTDSEIYHFFASSQDETKSGDIHIHLVVTNTERYQEFLWLKNYLLKYPNEAKKYSDIKRKIVKSQTKERKKYREIKSEYVTKLIEQARLDNVNKYRN